MKISKYTISILEMVKMYTPDSTEKITKRIEEALPKIFNFDFPIFKESHRVELEKKIVMHYLNKEIGLETPQLFKVYLEMRLNEIMPYYNEMYRIAEELNGLNLLEDINIFDDFSGIEKNKNENLENVNTSMNFTGSVNNSENETVKGNGKKSESVTDTSTNEKEISNTLSAENSKAIKNTNSNTVDVSGTENTEVNISKNANTITNSETVLSDFPQGNINNVDYASGSSITSGENTSSDTEENTTKKADNQKTTSTLTEKTDETITNSETNTGKESSSAKNTSIRTSSNDEENVKELSGKTTTENKTINETNSTNNFNGEKNNTSQLHRHGLGGNHTVASMIIEYRNAIMNVDMMIISELSDLFMKIY